MLLIVASVLYLALSIIAASKSGLRVLAAFLVAPLAPGVLLAMLALDWHYVLFLTPFSYCFGLVGFPLFFLFRWLNWLRSWHIIVAATFAGALMAIVAGFSALGPGGALRGGSTAVMFAACGCLSGFIFWLVAFMGTGAKRPGAP